MNYSRRMFGIATLMAAAGALLPACESTGRKSKPAAKTLDRQGVQTVAVLAHYLFPRGWDEAMQVSMARRMYPLEYHGNAHQGRVLIQSKVEFDAAALQRLLADAQKVAPDFRAGASDRDTFDKGGSGESGVMRQLSWWKPARQKDAKYYFWSTNWAGEPEARIWLQVSDADKGKRLVYIQLESD